MNDYEHRPEFELQEYTHQDAQNELDHRLINGRWFKSHPPIVDQAARYENLRNAGAALAHLIVDLVPVCDERHAALLKLREVIMLSNAGIACNETERVSISEVTPG